MHSGRGRAASSVDKLYRENTGREDRGVKGG